MRHGPSAVSTLWPRLAGPIASAILDRAAGVSIVDLRGLSALEHPAQIYAPTGGTRALQSQIAAVQRVMREVAEGFGYPSVVDSPETRVRFDRAAAPRLLATMELLPAEAGVREVWSFLATVVLPDVTAWRFGDRNRERWIASDLTRHMFARLWWQAWVFGEQSATGAISFDLLDRLSESDLNQLLERRNIGGNPPLARNLAKALLARQDTDVAWRDLVRDATCRVLRRLAYIDVLALDEGQMFSQCVQEVDRSIVNLASPAAR